MTSSFIPPAPLQTAVLFLVFNRPDTTAQVFEAIRQAKPPRLYVAADGPRVNREGEAEQVTRVREIATAVDWPCEVKTLFRAENLGCKYAVSGGITWFFENEEQGIILEDDCLPHPDFFGFCETLLERYATDERVSVITGNNFQNGMKRGKATYYFSRYAHVWGWATWRRSWRLFEVDIPFWPEWSKSKDWVEKLPDPLERQYRYKIFDHVYAGKIDSWAYPWGASLWYRGGLTATPNVNLVKNIGFGVDATHTKSASHEFSDLQTMPIGEITHPHLVRRDEEADAFVFDWVFGGRNYRFPRNVIIFPRRVLYYIYRRLRYLLK